jgi:hypothetical protein
MKTRITPYIPGKLHKELKIKAAVLELSMSDICLSLIKKWLNNEIEPEKIKLSGDTRPFPLTIDSEIKKKIDKKKNTRIGELLTGLLMWWLNDKIE